MSLKAVSTTDALGFYKLQRTYSELYQRKTYLCPLKYVQNRIIEYDIRSANTSCLRRARKLKSATLDELEALPKKAREVAVGNMIREDKSIQQVISREIIRAKRELFEANHVQDSDILSIKNDAVYIIGRKLKTTQFGPIEFRPKGVYSLYMNIEKIEFYYDKANDTVDVKGVKDAVVLDPDQQAGMVRFFAKVMRMLCYDRRDALRKYLIEFSEDYKDRKLPVQYYKEFNGENIYRTDIELAGYSFNLEMASDSDREILNGIYNYKRFVLPFIQQYI